MATLFPVVVSSMAILRIALGAAPFVAAGPASRLFGFPVAHDSPTARLMGRFFGVRDIGLGVLVFYALLHRETLPFIFLFNASMDAGDLGATLIPLVRREGIDRAARLSALMATIGGLGWIVVWLVAG